MLIHRTQSAIVLFSLLGWLESNRQVLSASELHQPQTRHPVAMTFVQDGRRLAIANQRSGTISFIDPDRDEVTHEISVGTRPSELCVTTDGQRLLVVDEESHELIAVDCRTDDFQIEKRMAVSPFPVSVRVSDDGSKAFVASLWSKTISIIDLKKWFSDAPSPSEGLTQEIHLPFAPRVQLEVRNVPSEPTAKEFNSHGTRLVVADAFGSKIAIIDPETREILSIRELPAHAIRGMRLHPRKPVLMITHQMLNRLESTTFDDIHWGGLMLNCLRSIELSSLLDPLADLKKHSELQYLGGPEKGAGDPAGFIVSPTGFVGVALSGTDEFLCDDGREQLFIRRIPVGNCPTAVVMNRDGSRAYVANSLSDSISAIRLAEPNSVITVSLGTRPEFSAIDRGELLFHTARLSHDRWFSCASCHVDGHTNGQLTDNFTDGTFGTAKRVLTLRGIANTAPYAWNGRFTTLTAQIAHSVQSTMQGDPLAEQQASDLAAYLNSLPAIPNKQSHDPVSLKRGAALFAAMNCRDCHTPPQYTSNQIVDIDLRDERGLSQFNPPSLRGVSQNGPYFHDGRAKTLEEVFTRARHQLDHELSPAELRDLIVFLSSL